MLLVDKRPGRIKGVLSAPAGGERAHGARQVGLLHARFHKRGELRNSSFSFAPFSLARSLLRLLATLSRNSPASSRSMLRAGAGML